MKYTFFLFTLLVTLNSCNQKEPLEYYNKAVYAENMAVSLNEMEARFEPIEIEK